MITDRIAYHYQQRKNELPWILAAVVLLLTISTLISRIDYFTFTPPKSLPATQVSAHPVQLASLHLFGLFSDDFDDLPETQLQLTLQGTGVDPQNAKLSSAIIASPDSNNANIYHIGDTLPGGALIKDILFDRIVIDNNGELQKLSMKVPTLQNQPPSQGLPANSGLTRV